MLDACTDRLEYVQSSKDVLPGVFGLVAGVLSFWAHPTYVARLDIVWAGGMVSLSGWQELLNSLLIEWSESNLLVSLASRKRSPISNIWLPLGHGYPIVSMKSTYSHMCSDLSNRANMAFLALSDVGPSELASSVISTFFSIGSIAVGLHHIWRHRVKKDSQLGDAVRNVPLSFCTISDSLRRLGNVFESRHKITVGLLPEHPTHFFTVVTGHIWLRGGNFHVFTFSAVGDVRLYRDNIRRRHLYHFPYSFLFPLHIQENRWLERNHTLV